MKKAVITGAAGFIGRNLSLYLAEQNIEVFGVDLKVAQNRILQHEMITPLSVNISDKTELSNVLKNVKADTCYHLAWSGVSTDVKNDVGRQASNILTTMTVLESCAEAGCQHVVIPGSASEYAYCGETIDGNNHMAPGDAYAASKAATQILSQWYAKQLGLNMNWLLIGSIYGPGRNDSNILTYTIKSLLNGDIPNFTKLEQMWDYIYIDDLVNALYCVGMKGRPNTVYPVGSGDPRPLAEYIMKVQKEIAPNAILGIGAIPYKNGNKPDNSVLDISALHDDTGFTPKVLFEEGIQKTIQYFKELELNQ